MKAQIHFLSSSPSVSLFAQMLKDIFTILINKFKPLCHNMSSYLFIGGMGALVPLGAILPSFPKMFLAIPTQFIIVS